MTVTIRSYGRMTTLLWIVPLALVCSCSETAPPPTLSGTVVCDDASSRDEEKLVPLIEATVFVTVMDDFQPPAPRSLDFTMDGADEDSPRGRRTRAIQEIVRAQPAGFSWDGYRPTFGGEAGTIYETRVDDEGRFSFETIPAGRHMLTVCYKTPQDGGKRRRSMARAIMVREGETTEVDVMLTRFDVVDM